MIHVRAVREKVVKYDMGVLVFSEELGFAMRDLEARLEVESTLAEVGELVAACSVAVTGSAPDPVNLASWYHQLDNAFLGLSLPY